jgi:hypothetical protein
MLALFTKVKACAVPEESALWRDSAAGDFTDCYCVRAALPARRAAEEVAAFPRLAAGLLAIRNALVRPFGLQTGPAGEGDHVGVFPVLQDGPDELIAGLDDRHLNFKISVLTRSGDVFLSTWVRPHNLGGRAYLALVMPFHILIVRHAAARLLKYA